MESQDTSLTAHREKVALALAIVKSKPAEVSLREHILQIRRNIQEGRRQLFTQPSHRYVDGVAFWKDCCEKGKEREAKLSLRIAELEKLDHASTSKPKRRKAAAYAPRKRQKRGAKSTAAATRKPSGLAEGADLEVNDIAVKPAELGGHGSVPEALFMRHLYCYRQMIHSETLDPDKLSPALVWLCSATARIVSFVCDHPHSLNPTKDVIAASETLTDDGQPPITLAPALSLTTLFRTLARIFTLLTHGFNRLNESSQNTAHQGEVTYHLVKLFSDILDSIHMVSMAISKAGLDKIIKTHGYRQGHQEEAGFSIPDTTDPETDLRAHLCQMLVTMLTHVDTTKPGHDSLSDGFLCLLLQRAGQRLRFFVFEDEPSPSNPDQSDEHHLQSCIVEAVKRRALCEEAKYLVWTLKRAMAIVRSQPNRSEDSASAPREADKSSLAEAARTRFQYTLLQGVFGADVEEFRGGLSMPAVAEAAVDVDLPTVRKEDTAEWFKQELWALCGWEALGQHLDFTS